MKARDGRGLAPETLAIVRRKAVEAVTSGELSQTQAAAVFGVSRSAVAGWLKAFREGGPEALRPQERGRPVGAVVERLTGGDFARHVMEHAPPASDDGLWTPERLAEAVRQAGGRLPSRWTMQRLLRRWGLLPPPEEIALLGAARPCCAPLLAGRSASPAALPGLVLDCRPHAAPASSSAPGPDGHWLMAHAPRGALIFCGLPAAASGPELIPAFLEALASRHHPGPLLLLPAACGVFRPVFLAWLRRNCRRLRLPPAGKPVVYLLHQN